jgi:hypothetical protein
LQNFYIWFTTGIEHIADWKAFDHILFLLALCCVYSALQWKNVIINITAFTIGHSFSLALSVLNFLKINSSLVEFLIPITIVITCVLNIINSTNNKAINHKIVFILTILFGLIHGLGFSSLLKQMLGKEESILFPLFSFNLGIEIGQLLIVSLSLLLSFFFVSILKIKQTKYANLISLIIFAIALFMAIERI